MTRFNKNQILLLISAFIVVSTLLAYEPIRHNGFINYDDDVYVTNNSNITGGITWPGIKWAFTKPYAANWHPLTWLSHMVDCELFGLNPLGHHLVSVLFHIANALLLFWILNNLTGAIWPGAFVAAVFALHPLQVESVAWAAERKTVLSGLFWFLTIAVYSWYTKRGGIGRYIAVLGTYALCIMTKPIVVTLPFVLLLLDYWPLERVKKVSGVKLITEKIPLLVLSAILSIMTIAAQRGGGAVVGLEKISLVSRLANMFLSYISYIGKTIWPRGLAVFYPYSKASFSDADAAVCGLLFVLILLLSIYIGLRRKYATTGWLWYVGTLVPVIGLVQAGSQAMANRYMYLSMLGLLIIVAWGIKDLIANRARWRVVAAVSAAIVLSSAAILTRMQVGHWQNSLTLFEHTLKVTKNNAIAENSYGCALYEAGRANEAMLHLSNAVRISPTLSDARNNLGKVFLEERKPNEAIECFSELIRRKQGSAEVYYDLAGAYGMQKKYDEAGKCLAKTLESDANYPNARNRMGSTLLAAGKPEEAIAYLHEALRINPNQAEIYANLGTAYIQLGKYGQAIENWTKAVELDPNNANALNNLAWTMATVNEGTIEDANKAIELAKRACELKGDKEPELLDTLAAAYAAAGRFEEAMKTAEKAIDTAKAGGREDLVGEIQKRMELYRAGKQYRQK
jgi:tetratricopeptide (TPR) repeat protein